MTILSAILGIFSNDDEQTGPTGADASRTAVQEFQDLAEREFTASLGEPDIIQQDSQFFNDPKVVVPVYNGPFEEEQRLVFDLPRGVDDDMAQFNQLLSLFGVDFDTMEDLAGFEAPVRFAGGNLVVDWEAIDPPEDSLDKGGEENPHTAEDVEEMSDAESDSGVTVEETTISADDTEEPADD